MKLLEITQWKIHVCLALGNTCYLFFKRVILIATQIEISRTIAKNIKLDKETELQTVDRVFMLKSHGSSKK